MIHYHGGPVTPTNAAVALWTRRHALVSFARPEQLPLAAEICQSFCLDNGAYSLWQKGEGLVDVGAYVEWVREYRLHPGFDFAIIPDAIDGDAAQNDALIDEWQRRSGLRSGVPVWHLHEPVERLRDLCVASVYGDFPRVALGSSGDYAKVGTSSWWNRIDDAMRAICDHAGRPICKLHGLRMLAPTVFSHVPLASADSCNVARNIGIDSAWRGSYAPVTKMQRALVLAERIESHAAAVVWSKRHGVQQSLDLLG